MLHIISTQRFQLRYFVRYDPKVLLCHGVCKLLTYAKCFVLNLEASLHTTFQVSRSTDFFQFDDMKSYANYNV